MSEIMRIHGFTDFSIFTDFLKSSSKRPPMEHITGFSIWIMIMDIS